jgi:hypothetical protein
MRQKMLDYIQPRENASSRNDRTQQEIQNFLLAVRSYPDCAAKDPGLTFRQHLSSVLASNDDRPRRN